MARKPTCLCGECSLCKQRVSNRAYIERNREKTREAARRRYDRLKPALRDKAKEHYHTNREQIRAQKRREYAVDPAPARAATREWNAKNPHKKRAARLKRVYGLSAEAYEQMLKAQDGTCALCPNKFSNDCPACVDHDHTTGLVRALLCTRCNLELGSYETTRDRHAQFEAYAFKYVQEATWR